jgi:epoxyqueuosine reductase QueG
MSPYILKVNLYSKNVLASLLQEAQSIGFLAAISAIELTEKVKGNYQTWLAEGKQASMAYLENPTRLNPQHHFAWAKSVLVLAAPHAYPDPGIPAGGVRIGKVARYAWVRDYHLAIEPHLKALEELAAGLGIQAKGYVDHGPLSERSYAALGGLGWIGKNTMLMRMGEGSYLTLAALLTDQPVPTSIKNFEKPGRNLLRPHEASPSSLLLAPSSLPLTPYPSRCGTCTRCITACPTNALHDRTLDARLCISYWTIEHRGLIPTQLWPAMGDWLFGCDICQEVCPWNRKAKTFWQGFAPQAELAHPDLGNFFDLSGKAFARLYAGTVFLRPGRTRMARNALIVLANWGDDMYLSLVRKAAGDVNPVVRATAAHALVRLGDRESAELLLRDPDALVTEQANLALGT